MHYVSVLSCCVVLCVFQRTPLHYAAASGVDTVCNIVEQNGECEDVCECSIVLYCGVCLPAHAAALRCRVRC